MSRLGNEFYKELEDLRRAALRDKITTARFKEDVDVMIADEPVADMSVQRVFLALVEDSHERLRDMDPNDRGTSRFMEALDAVNTSLFSATMGQIIYTTVHQGYEMPELIGMKLVTVQQTNFNGEKIPGVARVGDQVEIVNEGDPYPRALLNEYWIETPSTIKRGLTIDVTKEAVFFDRTNLILSRAKEVGEQIAINREKRILDVVLGISTVYRRNGAAPVATYSSDNTTGSNALVDWTSVDTVDTKFSAMTDPDTGDPIIVTPDTLIIPPALRQTASRIQNATMTGTTTSSRETRVSGPSLKSPFTVETNQYVRQRTSSDTTWFYGKPKSAFAYMQNFPLKVVTQGASSQASFDRDIVSQSKASERGAAACIERLHMVKATA